VLASIGLSAGSHILFQMNALKSVRACPNTGLLWCTVKAELDSMWLQGDRFSATSSCFVEMDVSNYDALVFSVTILPVRIIICWPTK
jgi:carbon starvation protein CstA